MSEPWEAPPMPEESEGWFDQDYYWIEVERLAEWGLEQEALIEAGEVDEELGGLSQLTIDSHPYMDAESAPMIMVWTNNPNALVQEGLDYSAAHDAVEQGWAAVVGAWASAAMVTDVWDMMKELRGSENPSRARSRGRGRMGRRNFEPYQHAWLARQSRGVSGEYETTAQAARKLGDDKAADVADRRAIAWDIRAHNEDLAEAGNWDEARDRVGRNLKYAERTRKSWQDRARRGTANPPRDGKWHRVASGYALRGADQYVAVVPYKPRGQGTVGGNARRFAEVYEHQKGAKVPKGTKYLAALAWYGEPMMKILGAHKTLKAAKAAGAKALGIKAPRRRARANAHNGAGAVVLVKTSARARPVRVKLPAKTKPKRVGDLTVHRSISYKGSKLRLLKGWTVTTSAGRGVGRYKTKQAAMAAARRAR